MATDYPYDSWLCYGLRTLALAVNASIVTPTRVEPIAFAEGLNQTITLLPRQVQLLGKTLQALLDCRHAIRV